MKRLVLLAAMAAAAAGCTPTELDQGLLGGQAWDIESAAGRETPDDPYFTALYQGYLALARQERTEYDWADAAEFRARALKASRGEPFGPINPTKRIIPEAHVPALEVAYFELAVFAANEGARLRAGRYLGEVQVWFDCWLQEAEEDHQPQDIADCKTAYEELIPTVRKLAKLPDNIVVVLPEEEGGAPGGVELKRKGAKINLDRPFAAADAGEGFGGIPVAESEIRAVFSDALGARPKPPRDFVITFDFDSTAIREEFGEQIRLAVEEARSRPAPEIVVTGYADAPGDATANLWVSRRRAEVVMEAIRETLNEGDKITLVLASKGARDLAVRTARAEESNRRVVITVR